MSVYAALCCSWLILFFFFLFMASLSNWRSFVVQMGSLVIGILVAGTAVYATLNAWPPPFILGGPANWQVASWVALSLIIFAVYWYDQRTAVVQKIRGISNWALYLLSLFGGWGGALLALLFLPQENKSTSAFVITSLMALFNIVFWVWLLNQM